MNERKLIRVDNIPNKSWSEKELVEIGLKYGIDFPNDCKSTKEILGLGKEVILATLYAQLEFEEYQDRVSEIKEQRSAPKAIQYNEEFVYKAKIHYIGNFPMISFVYQGKPAIFLRGIEYKIGLDKKEFVKFLSKRKDFDVKYDEAEPEDSLLTILRESKRSLEDALFYGDQEDDITGEKTKWWEVL